MTGDRASTHGLRATKGPRVHRPNIGTDGDVLRAHAAERAEAMSHSGSWWVDPASGQAVISKELFRQLGFEDSAAPLQVADVVERFVHPDDRERIQEMMAALMLGEEGPLSAEYRIVRRDGSIRWLYSEAESEKDDDGRVVSLVGYVQDVTARKREQMVADARLRLIDAALNCTLDELLDETLHEARTLTDSEAAFLDVLAEDQARVTLHASSGGTRREFSEGERQYKDVGNVGLWVECVRQRRAVIRNDLESMPGRNGWPEWDAPVVRELIVPVIRGDRVAACLGVGNKPGPYVQDDVDVLRQLADLILDVINRKHAEDQLRLSEALYRTLLEHAPNAICVERNGEILFANETHMKLFGYSSLEQLRGLSPTDLVAPADRAAAIDRMRSAHKEGHGVEDAFELTGLRSDGTTFPMLFRSATAVLPDGPATIVFHEDLTELRRADEALRASEEKFETAFNTAPVLMVIVDVETERIVDVSDEGVGLSGFTREELIGARSVDLGWMTPEVARAMRETFATHGRLHGVEMTRRRKDGRPVDILMFADPVTVGGRACVLFTGIDITQRRTAERQLAETRALQEAIADSTEDYIWSVEPESFGLTSFNREFHGYMEQSRDVVIELGMKPADLFAAGEREVWIEYYRRALALGSFHAEYEVAGRGQFLSLSFHELRHGDKTFGISVFARDVTEARRAEQALRDSESRLRQSQKMEAMGRLAGGIAHDFNNVLTAIGGYAQLLDIDMPEGSAGSEDVAQIRSAVARAAALTSKLLAFSGRQPARPVALDLAASIGEFVPILRRVVPERIDLVTNLAPTATIIADPTGIEQVVLNLVVNAVDAIEATGHIEIDTSTFEREAPPASLAQRPERRTWVQLLVSDNGAGMSEETARRAFEPFFTTKAVGEGTGLGLATVYGVVERLGGTVEVVSAPGAGTSVVIELPATAGAAPQKADQSDERPIAGHERILLVEDEGAVRDVTRTLLARLGYSVMAVPTPQEALGIDARAFDLLITDVVMPGMDGTQLARELRATRPDLPVLYVSGYQPRSEARAALDEPRSVLLPKPFTQSSLAEAVRRVLRQQDPLTS